MDFALNQYAIAGVVAWLIAFSLNHALNKGSNKAKQGSWLVSGGMPSKHTSVVVAVTATALIVDGMASGEFAIAGTLTAVAMYDAVNVRRATGENRAAILALYDHLKEAKNMHDEEPLREFKSMGHKPEDVAVGLIIGCLAAVLVNLFF